ncbi:MAG TPA: N-acetylmuramoyl-L-alanine amidase [Alphaproteobacteria bacterium]|jgi:N-acetylmuramoyl-L-alanine amidase
MRETAFIDCPSPNHDLRAPGTRIELLIVHYTGMPTADGARARLCDPEAKVSSHYLIDEGGLVFRLVAEDQRAWHAGAGGWAGREDVNSRSIGIELANPGHEHGYQPFPTAQMASFVLLARGILARHPISAHGVLGHSDVAPTRKTDPGELFDWRGLAADGIGLWPDLAAKPAPGAALLTVGATGDGVRDLQGKLTAYGYQILVDGLYGGQTASVVTAFQRHFRPWRIDGQADPETLSYLDKLLKIKR